MEDRSLRAPSVILLDISLGSGMSGIQGAPLFRQRWPGTEIIMLTVYEDEEKIFRALCAGASGYLLKNTPPDRLMEAISEVHTGGAPITPGIARKVLRVFTSIAPVPTADFDLTPREREILQHLVKGSSYKAIAHNLFISIDTVSSHIKKVYQKLQVHSKSEAVLLATKHRLV